jgi:hypothetical protein
MILALVALGVAAPARPIPVRRLFVDASLIERSSGISLRLHPPRKTGEKALQADRPWENATLNWFTVLKDRGVVDRRARFRMWYECYDVSGWPTADDTSFCYAESRDGVHWTKPELGLTEYQGGRGNNILFRQVGSGASRSRVHGSCVWIDPAAPPAERYKAVSQGIWQDRQPPHQVAGMVSPDGIHWTRLPEPICAAFADSQFTAFRDATQGKFVLFGRAAGNVGRSESADFGPFPPLQPVLAVDGSDPPSSNLYNSAISRYAGLYLAFPSLYDRRPGIDAIDIRLAVSGDGVQWARPDRDRPFIPLGPSGAWDSGSLYIGQGLIEEGDEVWLYYSGSPLKHQEAELENLVACKQPRAYSRVTLKRDRFASASAGSGGGRLETQTLTAGGGALTLNAAIRPGGSVRVALLGADGKPLKGRGLADCVPLTGDGLRLPVRWRGKAGPAAPAGAAVRLNMELRDADLFALTLGGR